MEIVIAALVRSQVTDEVKRYVLQNCLTVVENSEFSDDLLKLTTGLLSLIDELHGPGCTVSTVIPEELLRVLRCVLQKTPDIVTQQLFRSMASDEKDTSRYSKAVLLALWCDTDNFHSYAELVRADGLQLSELFKNLVTAVCSLGSSTSEFCLKAIVGGTLKIASLLPSCLNTDLGCEQLLDLAHVLLQFMKADFISPTHKVDGNMICLIDLSFAIAELLIFLFSIKINFGCPEDESLTRENVVSEFVHRGVETLIADPFTCETAYVQLASLLFRLDSDLDFTPVASFVDSLVLLYSDNIQACFSILRRMTCWLVWPFQNKASPLDKWIIGFLCEVVKRTCLSNGAANFSPSEEWVAFMGEQLQLILRFLAQQYTTDTCILNVLAFLLLAGSPVSRAHRFNMFNKELTNSLHFVSCRQRNNVVPEYDTFVSRITRILQLAISSVCASGAPPVRCTLREMQNPAIRFFSQFEEIMQPETLMNRSKVYEWCTLLQWGSRAGDNLRRCWRRWEQHGRQSSCSSAPAMHGRNTPLQLTDHGGLLNMGNTCYANATLQLLYHCPDFRLAVLENPRIQSISAKPVSTKQSAFTKRAKLSSNVDSAVLGESRGGLHLQLFSLFRSLSTHMGAEVRDPAVVLNLSKPAHFVSGEQQDAVEYLIHLLQQLHDEEVALKRDLVNASNGDAFQEAEIEREGSEMAHHGSFDGYKDKIADGLDIGTSSLSVNDATSRNHSSDPPVPSTKLSVISGLFGGTLVRHTSCTECFHISSILDEPFSCLYLPVTPADEAVTRSANERFNSESAESTRLLNNDDTDLATLLHTHFSQIERVSSAEACESCGKQTVLARRICLKNLASHVLICLKVFTFCRENQTSTKVMKKIAIPERLCVTLSGQDDALKPEIQPSESFSNEVILPSEELSEYPTNTILFDAEKRACSATSLASSSSYCLSDKTQSVTTRTFKLQGMILHHGVSLHCGHYTCVARVGMEWISFDDAFVHLTSLDQIYSRPLTTPYLLLYTQV